MKTRTRTAAVTTAPLRRRSVRVRRPSRREGQKVGVAGQREARQKVSGRAGADNQQRQPPPSRPDERVERGRARPTETPRMTRARWSTTIGSRTRTRSRQWRKKRLWRRSLRRPKHLPPPKHPQRSAAGPPAKPQRLQRPKQREQQAKGLRNE